MPNLARVVRAKDHEQVQAGQLELSEHAGALVGTLRLELVFVVRREGDAEVFVNRHEGRCAVPVVMPDGVSVTWVSYPVRQREVA